MYSHVNVEPVTGAIHFTLFNVELEIKRRIVRAFWYALHVPYAWTLKNTKIYFSLFATTNKIYNL